MLDWLTREVVEGLAKGVLFTLFLTAVTTIISLVLGVGVGSARMSPRRWVRGAARVHVEVFRNVPALIQIIFWAFAVPNLVGAPTRRRLFFDNGLVDLLGDLTTLPIPYYAAAACLGLSLNTSAYVAELFRAGVGTIPSEQLDAARSLGATALFAFRTIVLPGGLRAAFPALSTRLVHNMKNTALASFVTVPELFHEIEASINETFRATEFLLTGAVIYLVLSGAMTLLLRRVEIRLHRGRKVGYV